MSDAGEKVSDLGEGVRWVDSREKLYPRGILQEIGLTVSFGKVYEFWPFTMKKSHIRGHFPGFDRKTVIAGFHLCLDSVLRTNEEMGIQLPFDPREFKQFLKLRCFSLCSKRFFMVLPSDSCPEEVTTEPVGGSVLLLMCRRLGIKRVFRYYGLPMYFDASEEATLQDALEIVNGLTKGPIEKLAEAETTSAEFLLPPPLATEPDAEVSTEPEAEAEASVETEPPQVVPPSPNREEVRRRRSEKRIAFFKERFEKHAGKGQPKAVQKLLPLPRRITRQRAKDLGIQVTDKLM
jgi:hypothetical protein